MKNWKVFGVLAGSVLILGSALSLANSQKAATGLTVTLYMSTDCPVVQRQSPRIQQIVSEFAPKGVRFEGVFPNDLETSRKLGEFAKDRKFSFPMSLDLGASRAKQDGIKTVPTAVVKDSTGKVVYFGAIDDHKVDALAKNNWLRDALSAATSGKSVKTAKTVAFGCTLMPSAAAPSVKTVTYADHAAKIIQDHCLECHRPGETGPFSLEKFEEARKWAPMIAAVTKDRKMPPWPAVEGIGEFHSENRLTEQKIATLQAWSDAGAPSGDLKKAPPMPNFPKGWQLGEPDQMLEMKEPISLSADGADEYWNFVIKPDLKEEIYIDAIDVKPGNRKVVHHVIVFLDEQDRGLRKLSQPGSKSGGYLSQGGGVGFNPDGSLGGWAPGVKPIRLPDGAAIVVKPGTSFIIQVHYHKTGKPETDQTKIGLYLTKKKPTRPVEIAWAANPRIRIPAGEANVSFKSSFPMPIDVYLYSLMPHMHLLGKSMKATLIHPDGEAEPLVSVEKWDFNWQMVYALKQPKLIKKGSKLIVEAVFDNSENNPNNPSSPPKTVTWGEETTDEMMLLVAHIAPAKTGEVFSEREFYSDLIRGALTDVLTGGKKKTGGGGR